ncbi:MAG: ATP-grasp domain-containing protein [ANME-2 cluster archaeon]|nr:ATP-grasp domain-containing protein [ANME-2 cluster archaeon]MBC2701409.1 ATP-grasp domain-containing protein [ANME-2 cluster archaeon]MBC2707003.1 ATP-grasp domain-containing protein [ANME-2 cluster archaeon]MBC2746065.1 ATP-grasp domain-containing protein [ANME-2 cluster archaeon]MBC2763985.1 ATP-grasp domain-containing protein [ANME-2 cluster archaeon]
MDIMVAEYAVGAGEGGTILLEGRAMLDVLAKSFIAAGHKVVYPTSGPVLPVGTAVKTKDFDRSVEELSAQCDAALVVAPDELLGDLTEMVEKNTINLGCPSGSVRLCADKLKCTRILENKGIKVPATTISGEQNIFSLGDRIVLKPRWGCASEDTTLTRYSCATMIPEGFVATRYIEGGHLSASLIVGNDTQPRAQSPLTLPLTVNRQNISIGSEIQYNGGTVGVDTGRNQELFRAAQRSAEALGCRGYVGVDIVLADKPWVIDVNPRPTTSIIGISKIMEEELGELILKAHSGDLPFSVNITNEYNFTKADLTQ